MTEFSQPRINDHKPPANQVYDINIALAESLEGIKKQDERHKKRERFWKKGGAALAIAPFVAAGVLAATPTGHKMETNDKLEVDVYALLSSLYIGLVALYGHDKNRTKGQELAVSAVPISMALNGRLQPFIVRRLEERESDRLKREKLRGTT